jgi:hypothetical protein
VEVKELYQVKILNRFAALENVDDNEKWEMTPNGMIFIKS